MERDLAWDSLLVAADRLDRLAAADRLRRSEYAGELTVSAHRRRRWLRGRVEHGLYLYDTWTNWFEPVRRHRVLGGRWREIQPVEQAVSKIERFLRERPARRRWWIVGPRVPPKAAKQAGELVVRNALRWHVDDQARIGWVDIFGITFDRGATAVLLRSNFPVELNVQVERLEIELRHP